MRTFSERKLGARGALGALALGSLLGLTGCPQAESTADMKPGNQDMPSSPPDLAPPPPKPLLAGCSVDDWCWSNPLPQGNTLAGVWGSSDNDVWAVGARGTILHWTSGKWDTQVKPTTNNLFAVWGSSAGNVFAIGERNTVLRWDGSKWNQLTIQVMTDNGAGTMVPTLVNLNSIWGANPNDVWIVGERGVIIHWDGNKLTQVTSPYAITLMTVWGLDATHVYATGYLGTLLKWDGTAWNSMLGPGNTAAERDKNDILTIWGTAENKLFISVDNNGGLLWQWDGSKWTLANVQTLTPVARYRVTSFWGSGTSIFAVGDIGYTDKADQTKRRGTFLKWDDAGNKWVETMNVPVLSLASLWGSSPTSMVAVGQGGAIVRYDGTTFTPSGQLSAVTGITGSSASNVTAVGDWGVTLRWNGTSWTVVQDNVYMRFRAVAGTDDNNLWSVGVLATSTPESRLMKWNGSSWAAVTNPTGNALKGLWVSANEGFAVGDSDTVLRRNGSTWLQVSVAGMTTTTLRAAWAADASNAWFVGGGDDNPRNPTQPAGRILYYNGSAVSVVTPAKITTANPPIFMYGVWGTAANNVWAVGDAGTILHWNGTTWEDQNSTTGRSLRAVWGSDTNNVYAAGDDGTVVYWNGQAWTRQDSGTSNVLQGVWGAGKDVFLGGITGTVLKKLNR